LKVYCQKEAAFINSLFFCEKNIWIIKICWPGIRNEKRAGGCSETASRNGNFSVSKFHGWVKVSLITFFIIVFLGMK
jgi:hypothetical protein